MLDKGIIERIVLDYKDIYKQALEDNIQTPAELPYFEGDFWPNVMEDNIRELEEEEEARKKVTPRKVKLFTGNIFNWYVKQLQFLLLTLALILTWWSVLLCEGDVENIYGKST